MRRRTLSWLAFALATTTAVWVVLLIVGQTAIARADTLPQKIATLDPPGALFYATYTDAALLTLLTVIFFVGLHRFTREVAPFWSTAVAAFIPMYGLANLVAYLSQIFVVPRLLALYRAPASSDVALVLLDLALQDWPGSAVQALNLGAYALLGIPSIVYGITMARMDRRLWMGSALLALSGVFSFAALTGVAVRSALLSSLTLVSGAVFLVAVILLGFRLRRISGSAL